MLGGAFTETDLSDKQCADLIMGTDELIPDFLALDPDNIVFKQPGSDNYICASRDDVKNQMNDPANIVLPCIGALIALNMTPNLVCGLKMSKLQALGVAYGGYVPLENIAEVVANSTEQVFQIEDYDSPITLKAIAGLRLFPEYAPEQVRVPFYPEDDENDDSYVRRLNEWGAQNNEPNIGDRWEDASQLLLGASHCQSGYEGQHIYRIVSASNPEYTINPRLLQRMKDTGCIMADSLPPVTDRTPQIDWQSQYLYQDAADYTPARRLFDVSMEQEEDKSVTERFGDLLADQLGDRGGLGEGLGELVSGDYNNRGQQTTLSFAGSEVWTTSSVQQDIIRILNQSSTSDNAEISTTTYVSAITEDKGNNKLELTYITNVDGAYTSSVDGYPNILVMNLDNEEKRNQAQTILEFLDEEIEMKTDEIEEFVRDNNQELLVEVKPFLVAVATIRPEELSDRSDSTRIIAILASDLFDALELSQPDWEQWYYNNVVKRTTNDTERVVSPDNITLYALDFLEDEPIRKITVETTVWQPSPGRIVVGDSYNVDIGYLQSITFPDSTSDTSDSMEQDGINNAVLGQEGDPTAQLRRILEEQLADREGMGVALAEAISGGQDRGEQHTLSFSGNLNNRSAIISRLNQYNSSFDSVGHYEDSYVLAIAEQTNDTDYDLTYLTNLDGALTTPAGDEPNVLVMYIENDTQRRKAASVLEVMMDDADKKADEIKGLNNDALTVSVKPFLIVVATVRPEEPQERDMSSRIVAVLASDLSEALQLSKSEWEQWFYNNVMARVGDTAATSNTVNLYVFDINDEVNGINVQTRVLSPTDGSIVEGNNFVVDIGFMQGVVLYEQLELEGDEMLSPIASPDMTPVASPSMSPIPMDDLTLNTPGSTVEPSTPDLSGGKKRQTRSKRGGKGKKAGKGKGKRTRRRRNNRNK